MAVLRSVPEERRRDECFSRLRVEESLYEVHTTIPQLSVFNQTRPHAVRLWNNNPEFIKEIQDENDIDR